MFYIRGALLFAYQSETDLYCPVTALVHVKTCDNYNLPLKRINYARFKLLLLGRSQVTVVTALFLVLNSGFPFSMSCRYVSCCSKCTFCEDETTVELVFIAPPAILNTVTWSQILWKYYNGWARLVHLHNLSLTCKAASETFVSHCTRENLVHRPTNN